jgi:serine/threonine protein phosphatase 1
VRLLAIGDIHGYLEKLQNLIELVKPTQEDQVVFLGDYIDRGPDSPGVIEFLMEFSKKFPKTIFIGGNHEQLLVEILMENGIIPFPPRQAEYRCLGEIPPLHFEIEDVFHRNGGPLTVRKYGGTLQQIPKSHIVFLTGCLLYHEITVGQQAYLFVHAGIVPGCPLKEQYPEDLLWIRSGFFCHGAGFDGKTTDYGMGGRIIVHGHTPGLKVPGTQPYRISVDSGVCLDPAEYPGSGKLTCCDVLTRRIWQT